PLRPAEHEAAARARAAVDRRGSHTWAWQPELPRLPRPLRAGGLLGLPLPGRDRLRPVGHLHPQRPWAHARQGVPHHLRPADARDRRPRPGVPRPEHGPGLPGPGPLLELRKLNRPDSPDYPNFVTACRSLRPDYPEN